MHPGDELLAAERLDHVVVGPGLEPPDALELRAPRGQHDHRDIGEISDAFQRLPAVEAGHRDVEHDEVRRRLVEGAQPGAAVVRLVDVQPGSLQQLDDEAADVVVIVHDQDSW